MKLFHVFCEGNKVADRLAILLLLEVVTLIFFSLLIILRRLFQMIRGVFLSPRWL